MSDLKPDYVYKAIDLNSKEVKGRIAATSESKAYQKLLLQGLTPTLLEYKPASVLDKDIQIPGLEPRAKLKSLVIFTKQFSLMFKAGMPMIEAINVSAAQTEDKVLKAALEETAKEVQKGSSFSDALKKHPLAFPGLLTAVAAVGEEGGFLDESLESMSATYKTELEMKQRIKSAMTYPLIVVGVALTVLIGMLIFVVPIFAEMFENMGAELPGITQFMVTVSDNIFLVIIPLAILIVGWIIFKRTQGHKDAVRSRLDALTMKTPIFGPLAIKTAIARFSRNLAMMIEAGVPLTSALELVATTSDNYHIEKSIRSAIESMENGGSLASSMELFDMFPLMVKNMISVGERSGAISSMLDSIADFYEVEVKELSEQLSEAIEPFLLVVLGVMVGGMLFALYTPMFSMFSLMSGG